MNGQNGAPDEHYWFVRLDGKLDEIRSEIGGHGEELVEHRVRLGNHDRELELLHGTNRELKQAREAEERLAEQAAAEERRHRTQIRYLIITTVILALAALTAALIPLLSR